jgi:hypothetical protein
MVLKLISVLIIDVPLTTVLMDCPDFDADNQYISYVNIMC